MHSCILLSYYHLTTNTYLPMHIYIYPRYTGMVPTHNRMGLERYWMHSWNPWIHSWNLGIESLESWQESEVPNPRNPQIHPQIRSPRWSHCIPGWMHYLSTTISYYPSYSIHSMHTPNTILHPTYQE